MSDTPETIASQYIADQLKKTRRALKRTQILSVIIMVFVVGYLSTIGYLLKTRLLNPEAAADVATSQMTVLIQEYGPEGTKWLKETVPPMVASLPDMLLAKLPEGRQMVEQMVEDQLQQNAGQAANDLAKLMDDYIANNKDHLAAFIEAAQHPEGVTSLGDALENELRGWLNYRTPNGESVQEILARTQVSLTRLEGTLDRLANADDLSAQEKKLRTAIAIIMQTTKKATATADE